MKREIERNGLSGLANLHTVCGGRAKRNFHKFSLAALKVLTEDYTEEATTTGRDRQREPGEIIVSYVG